MRNADRVNSEQKSGENRASTAENCFACNKFFIERKSLERRFTSICRRFASIVHKFENQNIHTLFDNTKFMGDLPFAIYFDFETALGKKFIILKKIVHFIQCPIHLWLLFTRV